MCSSFETSQYVTNNSGDSMSPLLTTGDVVAVKKGVAFEDL
jgi:phage repressor protein C with HTH and peptisase S24 domain